MIFQNVSEQLCVRTVFCVDVTNVNQLCLKNVGSHCITIKIHDCCCAEGGGG